MSRTARPPSSPFRRWLPRVLAAVAVLVVLGGGLWYWQRQKAAASEGAYRTTAVERGSIRVAISSTGTLSAISTVTVGSQISGQVTEILVDYNSEVKKGDVLARIDPKTYEAQIEQGNAQIASAQASLRQAQATLANAEVDYRRKAALVERQLVARSDVDLARAALDQARAQVNSAQASIRQQTASTQTTRVNLDRTVIRSPVDGVVLTRSIEPGQTVAASLQAPELFTIAEDLSKMKIELAVDEADIGQVREGQTVTFTADAFPDRQFRGEVAQVRLSATTTSNVVTYPVVVNVDNGDGTLLPGLTVNAEIEVSKRDDVLKLSNAALRYKPSSGVPAGGFGAPQAPAANAGSQPRAGGGLTDDLSRAVAGLGLDAAQQAKFDEALAAQRQRQEARRNTNTQAGGFGPPPGMMVVGGGNAANIESQVRQRMAQRMKEDFAAFRDSLSDAQKKQWDAALSALVNAKRSTLYKLVDGKPQPVMVRIGASDGSFTEVSGGGLQEGDLVVTGERARE
ncbi:efflux transporter periplasmic adaptor subunit [Pseudoxanthomonas jiangsuensis]|uniref:efflux RND transporter periplasmic adaptor subunit n=1 Tax=Pseudoxanthomonas jiangsuensis TaxID=619688 RepID=UPI001391FEDF|nr:efflux RND transporter periplasmic adaptor subunit [Pseudoxanthomonas jiangsuensis]KAF1695797.1 efflux transporter periplasmic adaptor subunit [Pseudoxanthomonas jiangsuensis]